MEKLTVGSWFAGIGGVELGLEETGGFKTFYQVEINHHATRILEKHWPNATRFGDAATVVAPPIPMSFAADSLVRTFQQPITMPPESKEVVQDSGGNYFERFAWYDRGSRLWRTFQCSLVGGWEPFSETWPKEGMTRNGVAYRLTRSAAGTEDCGCFLLPTPQASDGLRLRFSLENLKNADRNHREKGSYLGSYLAETLAAEFGLSQTPELSEYLMGFPIGFTETANGNGDSTALGTRLTHDELRGLGK